MRICLDSNCLRDKSLIEQAVADVRKTDGYVLIPDVLIGEMIKSFNWQQTMRLSLQILRKHSERVVVAQSTGVCMRNELTQGRACQDPYDENLTERFRAFLTKLNEDDQSALAMITDGVHKGRLELNNRQGSPAELRRQFIVGRGEWRKLMTKEDLNFLRAGNCAAMTKRLREDFVTQRCVAALTTNGYSDTLARHLFGQDSVTRRITLAYEASFLRWLVVGGLEQRTDKRIYNDCIDIEVAVVGTYCESNLSKDKIIQDLDQILRPLVHGDPHPASRQ